MLSDNVDADADVSTRLEGGSQLLSFPTGAPPTIPYPRRLSSSTPLSRTSYRRASPAHFLHLSVPSAQRLAHFNLASRRAIYEHGPRLLRLSLSPSLIWISSSAPPLFSAGAESGVQRRVRQKWQIVYL